MTNIEIIILALSLAVCWEVINPWHRLKPFNCMMCMTGWLCMIIAAFVHHWYAPLFFPVGAFAGAVFDSIRRRWL